MADNRSKCAWTAQDVARLREMFAAGAGDHELCEMLGRSLFSVKEKRSELGLFRRGSNSREYGFRPVPDDFKELSAENTQDWLAKHYRATAKTIIRWRRLTGYIKPPKKIVKGSGPRRWNYAGPKAAVVELDGSLAAQAARHLMRTYRPVCRMSTIDPEADKNMWRVGRLTLSGGELIDLAESKGFGERIAA